MGPLVLRIRSLSVDYASDAGEIRAVKDVSFDLFEGETLAIVGETGSGKSTIALAILDLLDPRAKLNAQQIECAGKDLLLGHRAGKKAGLGHEIGIVLQDPGNSLNPVLTVEDHIVETLRARQSISKKEALLRCRELLREVGIPVEHGKLYPFQLSGGISQRVGIALAICNNPRVLIADEPTSALDPLLQEQILDLLASMRQERGLGLLLISHDLILVSRVADRICAMYHGRIVESGLKTEIVSSPAHPYTRALLLCQPGIQHHYRTLPLETIPGALPDPGQDDIGCAFATRCRYSIPDCYKTRPTSIKISSTHEVACFCWRMVMEVPNGDA